MHGPVRISAAQSFRDVVDTLRICPVLGLTRASYLAMDKKTRSEVKQVPFFVAACFRESPSKRISAEATVCNLLFLDIDETREGICPAGPFVRDPDSLYSALEGYNFAAYTTVSSSAKKPRCRIVVDSAGIPAEDYASAVSTVGRMLGIARVTHESKVAVQPMFLPTLFADSSDTDHPLFALRLDARAFTVADISAPGSKEEGSTWNKPVSSGADALEFLRAPVPEVTLALASEALAMVDPDCSYPEWLELAAALRHQFSPHKAEEAYALFDSWSAEGKKYVDPDDTRAKWDSLRPSPVGRAPVTIRSLLRQATASGWEGKKLKQDCFAKVINWLEGGATSITELMEQGPSRILAMPLLSNVQEDVLVNRLTLQAKRRFAYTISAVAIRKDVARLKAEMRSQEKHPQQIKEPLWAKGVCYISAARQFFRHRTGEKYVVESFNATYARWLLPTEAQLKDSGISVTPAALAKPVVQPTDYSLNHIKIATVYDYAYDPSQPTEVIFVDRGKKYVNTYCPTFPEFDDRHADDAGNLLSLHLQNLISEEENRSSLLDFMSYMVQSPGQKIRWAVLIQSVEGAGKTFLAEAMKAVLGSEHVVTVSGESVKSGFNEWSFGHQVVVFEEVRVVGSNRHEIMNTLKPLITNDRVSVNQKFQDHREIDNRTNYLLFSNHHDAVTLSPGDRRYFVVKSPLQTKEQVLQLGQNYFPPLYAMLRDRAGALRSFLYNREISPGFSPDGHAPRTKYIDEMIHDSASELTAAVRRLLLEGDYPLIQFDVVSTKILLDVLRFEDSQIRVSPQSLAQVLREEGFREIGQQRFGGERHHLWVRSGISDSFGSLAAADRFKKNSKNLHMELFFC